MRPMVRPWSPIWVVAAMATSSTRSGGRSGWRRSSSRMQLDDEVVGAGLGVHALLAGLAERGADAVDEDDVTQGAGHGGPPLEAVSERPLRPAPGGRGRCYSRVTTMPPPRPVRPASRRSSARRRRGGPRTAASDDRGDQVDLPGAGAEPRRSAAPTASASARLGRGPAAPGAARSGDRRFSTGTWCGSGQVGQGGRGPAPAGRAATGSFSAQARGGGGPSARSVTRAAARRRAGDWRAVDRGQPLALVAPRGRRRRPGSVGQLGRAGGGPCAAATIAGVGQDPAGGDVARPARSVSRVCHSSRTTAEPAAVADAVHAGGAAPRVDPGRRPRSRARASNSCARPLELALRRPGRRRRRRAARPAPRRRARRSAATARAAGGWTSRRPSAPWPG